MRDICETLGVNRSSFYYQPKVDPSEAVLRAEIEKLAGRYPRYGYRRITQLLVRQGYTVGTRRVARLRKKSTSTRIRTSTRREIVSVIYHTGVSSETPTFGVRLFDTYGISTTNLILTLRNCGLNKRMHYKSGALDTKRRFR